MNCPVDSSYDVVHIKAQHISTNGTSECKKFSVDPKITSYSILVNLLSRCFNLPSCFNISYIATDGYGEQFYQPLLSDIDLMTALTKHSMPNLTINIDSKTREENLMTKSALGNVSNEFSPHKSLRAQLSLDNSIFNENGIVNHYSPKKRLTNSSSFMANLSQQMAKTFSSMQRAIGVSEFSDLSLSQPMKTPLNDPEFRQFSDNVGRIANVQKLKKSVYLGGVEPDLRKYVWRIILNVYPPDMTGQERIALMKSKEHQYYSMKEQWKIAYSHNKLAEDQISTLALISVDVVRTDKHLGFYSGAENKYRVSQLFDILATYCIYHPSIGYHQGMSDMASSLLFVQLEESSTYVCFCALMRRLHRNFADSRQLALITKMQHLHDLLVYTDFELAQFLRERQCGNMFFTQRWLLLELKREFEFDDALTMLECQWASIALRVSLNYGLSCSAENSKCSSSGGYLVLAEEDIAPLMLSKQMNSQQSVQCYAVRDVSLINSLVGDQWAVEVRRLSSIRKPLNLNASEELSSPASCSTNSNCTNDSNFQNDSSVNMQYSLDSSLSSASSPTEENEAEGLVSAVDLESNEVFPEEPKTPCSSIDGDAERTRKKSDYSKRKLSSGGKSRRRPSDFFESDPVQMKDWVVELPPPDQMGMGNPFLLFLCLALLLEYRRELMDTVEDASDVIRFYQKMKKKHNALRILNRARTLFDKYCKDQENKARKYSNAS